MMAGTCASSHILNTDLVSPRPPPPPSRPLSPTCLRANCCSHVRAYLLMCVQASDQLQGSQLRPIDAQDATRSQTPKSRFASQQQEQAQEQQQQLQQQQPQQQEQGEQGAQAPSPECAAGWAGTRSMLALAPTCTPAYTGTTTCQSVARGRTCAHPRAQKCATWAPNTQLLLVVGAAHQRCGAWPWGACARAAVRHLNAQRTCAPLVSTQRTCTREKVFGSQAAHDSERHA